MAKAAAPVRPTGATSNRCAIYTRKSSEEGLEQEFNSLDAQREACEAFIRSQQSAGWIALADLYDDGGVSGGTLERPALQRLLADIQAGRIDTVVVYKVDRLTRSLNDFARIVDAFDAKGVAFVSVTQQFNTTSSMGRLTLNMLLSFAQFERELTGERIRDKIAASKRKGLWMGGLPPLGYDTVDGKLVVNAAEAATVRRIFGRYAALGSVHALKDELDVAGVVSKRRVDRFGKATGGKPIARGALYRLLQSRIYRGQIGHKGAVYPGLQEAIIDADLWSRVQAALAANRVQRASGRCSASPSLLAGLVHDAAGERLSPTHANKHGRRYRYYVSRSLITPGRPKGTGAACRVPAADLEAIVEGAICGLLRDDAVVHDAAGSGLSIEQRQALIRAAAALAKRWPGMSIPEKRAILNALVANVAVHPDRVEIAVRPNMLAEVVTPDFKPGAASVATDAPVAVLTVAAQLHRTSGGISLVVHRPGGTGNRNPDRSLLRLLGRAQQFAELVMNGAGKTMAELAAEAAVNPSYFSRVFRLSFLAPEITTAMIEGRQPPQLTASKLALLGRLAPTWSEQRRQLGFG